MFIPNRDSFDSAQFRWLSSSFLPRSVKNTCLITSQLHVATNTVSLEARIYRSIYMQRMQRLICSVDLFINCFQGLKQKLHADWPGTATFVFLWPPAHQSRPKLAATQLCPPVDISLMWWELSETFSALRKFILDQLLFNGSRHLLQMWHTGTKQGVNSYGVCQIGNYLFHYEFLLAGAEKRGGQLATHLPSKSQGKLNVYKRLNISSAPVLCFFLNLGRVYDTARELHSPCYSHPRVGWGTQFHTSHVDETPSIFS